MPEYTFLNRPAAKSLYDALITEDPFYITLEQATGKDAAAAREAMIKYMDYSMTEAQNHGDLRLTEDQESGAAIWSIPLVPDRAAALSYNKKQFLAAHLGEKALAAYSDIVEFMDQQSKGVIAGNTWYLSILGITPESQGKGLGGALVRPVLETTDALGVSAYIESFTPSNFGFYEHLGFKTVKTAFEPVTGSEYAIMVHDPARGA